MADQPIHPESGPCYVYEIIVDGIVRYIGKGTTHRYRDHINLARAINRKRGGGARVKAQKFHNRLARAMRDGSVVEHRIVVDGLTSHAALHREVQEIAAAPPGQLWNELPGGQGASSEHFKRNWADPVIREKMMAALTSPEATEARKARAAIQWADQTARERNRQRTKAQWADPDFRASRTAALRVSVTPERNAKLSKAAKAQWADPERGRRIRDATIAASKARRGKKMTSEKARAGAAIVAERTKARWRDPAYRARMSEALKAAWAKRRQECST